MSDLTDDAIYPPIADIAQVWVAAPAAALDAAERAESVHRNLLGAEALADMFAVLREVLSKCRPDKLVSDAGLTAAQRKVKSLLVRAIQQRRLAVANKY